MNKTVKRLWVIVATPIGAVVAMCIALPFVTMMKLMGWFNEEEKSQ